MNRDEAFQWIMAGHSALIAEENDCDEEAPFVEVLRLWRFRYMEAALALLQADQEDCKVLARSAKNIAKSYLRGLGSNVVKYLRPSMRRQILYFGARFALTLAAILDNVDWVDAPTFTARVSE